MVRVMDSEDQQERDQPSKSEDQGEEQEDEREGEACERWLEDVILWQ